MNLRFANALIAYLAITFCYLATPKVANAALVLNSFSGAKYGLTNSEQTKSFNIVVGHSRLLVTQLGFFDYNSDGLLVDHEVGIWTPDGTLITSTTVPAGTTAQLVSQWRMVDIDPVTLLPGESYRIGAQHFGDRYIFNATSGNLNSLIAGFANPIGSLTNGPGFNFPDTNTYGGYNANATIIAVPEPSSVGILTIAISGVLLKQRRRVRAGV